MPRKPYPQVAQPGGDTRLHHWIGDVFEIPSQQEVNPVHRSDGNMQCILCSLGGHDTFRQQQLRYLGDLIGHAQKRDFPGRSVRTTARRG